MSEPTSLEMEQADEIADLRREIEVCRAQFDRVVARHIQDKRDLRARAERAEADVATMVKWIEGYPCACDRPALVSTSASSADGDKTGK